MDQEIPWTYVAIIFIAFVSWLWNRIREAAAYRRERLEQKRAAQRARRTTEREEEVSPYRQPRRPTPPEPREEEESVPNSLGDIYRRLEEQFLEEAAPPEPPRRSPPPLPGNEVAETSSFRNPREPAATSAPEPPATVVPSPSTPAPRPKRSSSTPSSRIKTMLSEGDNLRTALVLREILDKPRALRR